MRAEVEPGERKTSNTDLAPAHAASRPEADLSCRRRELKLNI
jgi:hypothetical protein